MRRGCQLPPAQNASVVWPAWIGIAALLGVIIAVL
jgi:predicted lysophospholipase L1 biosynthesis ABC-type transport system permease subunit